MSFGVLRAHQLKRRRMQVQIAIGLFAAVVVLLIVLVWVLMRNTGEATDGSTGGAAGAKGAGTLPHAAVEQLFAELSGCACRKENV
jgi:membrane protein implicated in regulation of membrane protease activity